MLSGFRMHKGNATPQSNSLLLPHCVRVGRDIQILITFETLCAYDSTKLIRKLLIEIIKCMIIIKVHDTTDLFYILNKKVRVISPSFSAPILFLFVTIVSGLDKDFVLFLSQ